MPPADTDIEPSFDADIEPSADADIEPSADADIEPSADADIEPSADADMDRVCDLYNRSAGRRSPSRMLGGGLRGACSARARAPAVLLRAWPRLDLVLVRSVQVVVVVVVKAVDLRIGSISASPTACPLRGCGRAVGDADIGRVLTSSLSVVYRWSLSSL